MIKFYQRFLLIALTFIGFTNNIFAQCSAYTFSQTVTPGAYVPLSTWATNGNITGGIGGITTLASGAAVGTYAPVLATPTAIGFVFPFNCRNYATCHIYKAGFIDLGFFGTSVSTNVNGLSATTGNSTEGVIQAGGGSSGGFLQSTAAGAGTATITYAKVNNSPYATQAFVVQYTEVSRSTTISDDRINLQIWLCSTGEIKFIYGSCVAISSTSSGFPVGIRGMHITDFNNRTGTWGGSTAGTAISSTSAFGSLTQIPTNLIYSFVPPACTIPSYLPIPACMNFENTWIDSNNKLPGTNWVNWPGRGNLAWFREDESTTNTLWAAPAGTALATAGANGTAHSARFHSVGTPIAPKSYWGDLDWYVDLSACPSLTKQLQFQYLNPTGNDSMRVFFSTDGGVTFTPLTKFTNAATWAAQTVPLGVVSSGTCIVRFRGYGMTTSNTDDIGIDEVCVGTGGTPPTITTVPASNTFVCATGQGNTNVSITASGAGVGGSYSWSPSLGLSATTGATVVANPIATTAYTVTGVDASCNTASTIILVSASPAYQLLLKPSASFLCASPNSATITTVDTMFGPITAPTSYCVSGIHTSSNNCISNVIFGAISNNTAANACAMPGYTAYTGVLGTTVMAGNAVPFTGTPLSANTTISVWIDYNQNGVFNNNEYTQIITAGAAGTAYTTNINIPYSAKVGYTWMRVRSRLSSSSNGAGDACTIFNGGETEDYLINILRLPITAQTFAWTPAIYLTAANTKNVTATNVANTTTYTLTVTDVGNCTISKTVTLNVTPLNCGTILATPSVVCVGSATKLSAQVSGGGAPYSYTWTGPNITNTANITIGTLDTVSVNPAGNTTYTLSVTDACGNTCSTTKLLVVSTPPTITINNPAGGAVQICGTYTNQVSAKAIGGVSYIWSPTPLYKNASGDSARINVTINTAFTVTGTDANGCTNTTSITVNIRPDYSLTTSATPAFVCSGGSSQVYVTDTVLGVQTPPAVNYCTANLHSGSGPCLDSMTIGAFTTQSTIACNLPSYTADTNSSVVQLIIGNTYTAANSIIPTGYSAIWIDYNANGIFEATEYTAIISNFNTGNAPFTIPTNAFNGIVRARFRSRSSTIAATEACTTFGDGETHDYIVNLIKTSGNTFTAYSWVQSPNIPTSTLQTFNTGAITSTRVYIVTATDANGCTKQSTVAVNVDPLSCNAITSNSGTIICSGKSIILSANTIGGGSPFTYSWKDASGVIGTAKNITVAPTTNTVYTVTVTDGCSPTASCTQTILINVNASPTINLNTTPANAVICTSGTLTLTASGSATNYNWTASSTPNFLNTTIGATVISTPLNSITYTVTGTDANSCTGTISKTVNYTPLTNITANSTPSGIGTCGGVAVLSINDTATGSTTLPTYCASAATTLSENDIVNVTFGTINNNSTCTSSGPGIVTNKYGDYTTTVPPATVYAGGTVAYSISTVDCNNTTYSGMIKAYADFNRNGMFTDAGENFYSSPNAVLGNNTISGTLTIPVTAVAGYTKIRIITSNTANILSIVPCSTYGYGETEDYAINIVTTPIYPLTYNWMPGSLPGAPVNTSPATTTTYTVTGTNAFGCSATASTTVTVGGVSCLPITAFATTICEGVTDTLTGNASLGTPPYTYLWSTGATSKTITTTPVTTTTYTVTIKDVCNATCSQTITINVLPKPTISIAQSIALGNGICVTGTNTLTATTNAVSPTVAWLPTIYLSTTTALTTTVTNPLATTNYTVTITNASGCTNTKSTTVLFSPAYTVTANALPQTICPNGNTTLTVTDTIMSTAAAPTTYCIPTHTTSTPCITDVSFAGFTASTGSLCPVPAYVAPTTTPVATFYAGTSIPLSVTTANNNTTGFPCTISVWVDYNRDGTFSATEWQQVSLNSLPGIANNIILNVPTTVSPGYTWLRVRDRANGGNAGGNACTQFGSGETEDYLVNLVATSSPSPVTNFAWSQSGTPIGTGKNLPVNNIPTSSTYTVVATNANGCTAAATVAVNVNLLSSSAITGASAVCIGAQGTLVGHPVFGGQPYTYTWLPAATVVSTTDSNAIVAPTVNTTYTLTISDACGSATTQTKSVIVNALPTITTTQSVPGICVSGTATITATGGNTYSWTPSTFLNVTNAAIVNCVNPNTSITYTVTGVNSNSCSNTTSVTIGFSNAINVIAKANSNAICAGQSVTMKVQDTIISAAAASTAYCTSNATSASFEEIFEVTFGSGANITNNISNCSVAATGPGSLLNQYSNFTNLPFTPVFYSNDVVPFTLNMGTCSGSGTVLNGVKIFVDFNRDGDFADVGENVYTSPISIAGLHTETGSFTIPNYLIAGNTRLRVVQVATNNPATITACGNYTNGETEDYLINLIYAPNATGTAYAWLPTTTPATGKIVTAAPSVSTTYTVTATNNIGCTASTILPITIAPLSVMASKRSTGNVCVGRIDTLTATVTGGGTPYTYLWSNGITTDSNIISVPGNIVYTLTVTDACGNTASSTVSFTTQSAPSITIASTPTNATICATGIVTLSATCAACASVVWLPTAQTTATIAATPNTTTTYTVVGADGLGCTGFTTITVLKSFVHNINIKATKDTICNNAIATFTTTDSSINAGSQVMPSAYCIPTHTVASPCITKVTFNTINNVTFTCGLPSYTNFNSITTNVLAGTTVPITVTTANNGGTNTSAVISVWIDYNQNAIFEPSEWTQVTTSTLQNIPVSVNIAIPSNAKAGVTSMRVRARSTASGTNTANDACSAFNSGETEDYKINIYNYTISNNMVYAWTPSVSFANATTLSNTTLPLNSTTTFTLTATDANGCSYTNTKLITVNTPLSITTDTVNNKCYLGTSGTIKTKITGGKTPYTFTYNSGVITAPGFADSAINLGAGTYTVTAQDALGCSISKVVYITQRPAFSITVSAVGASCFGGNNGTAYITPINGVAPYTYTWTDNNFVTLLNSLSPNADTVYNLVAPACYNVFANDNFGCNTYPDAYTTFCISQPSTAATVTATQTTDITCKGLSNGAITAVGTGGNNTSYQYALNTGSYQSNAIFTNLAVGTYTVFVKDANQCTNSTTIIVTEPTAVALSTVVTHPNCNGGTGTIVPTISGGTGGLNIMINNFAPIASYAVGSYTVMVSDNNSCAISTVITITQPLVLATSETSTAINCNGGTSVITPAATGGTAPYSFTINTTAVVATYPSGMYTIEATDAKGCKNNTTINITQPLVLATSATSTAINCNGGASVITPAATGGTAPYSFTINATAVAATYPSGMYTVEATDAKGCKNNTTINITEPTAIITTASATAINCNGGPSVITPAATGGTAPYAFTINATAVAATYPSGMYTVEATDAKGCKNNTTINITQPTAVIATASATAINCNGGTSVITPAATGGTAPYSFTINTTAVAATYPSGMYTVEATDAKGCKNNTTINITEPTAIIATASATAINCNGSTSVITPAATGGTAPYAFTINTMAVAATYPSGMYTIEATDAKGCKNNTTINITEPTAIIATASATAINCNGGTSVITPAATGGTAPYAFTINTTAVAATYPSGMYTVEATDAKGCKNNTTINITEPTAIIATASAIAINCNGSTSVITPAATGGTAPYAFTINTTAVAATFPSGMYTIEATDAKGCKNNTTINITQPTAIIASASATAINCNGGTSVITPAATGGTAPYTFTINSSAVAATYPSGMYTIEATDAKGCKNNTTINITQPTAVIATVSATAINCNGGTSVITPAATGGTSPYSFTINATAVAATYVAGMYTIEATDAKGCKNNTTINITEPTAIIATVSATAINCNGGTSVITPAATGGTASYTFTINTTAVAATYPSGMYTIEATDAKGCKNNTTLNITQPTAVTINTVVSGAGCAGGLGSIIVNNTGGTLPISYTINNAIDTINYPAGTYTISIIDANNCAASKIVTIANGLPLNIVTNAMSNTVCIGTVIRLWGSPETTSTGTPITYTWSGGIIDSNLFVYTGTAVYTITGTDGTCTETTIINIVPVVSASQLAQATTANSNSTLGTSCGSNTQIDNTTVNYTNVNCNLIATVQDTAGGNILGSVNACVNVIPMSLALAGSQPYVPRVVTITPQNQGPANVTLYYTNDDFLDYNAASNGFPLFATNATNTLSNGQTMQVCITKLSTADSITFSSTATWDSVLQNWVVTFPVTSFSTFYCHTCNPNNAPLGVGNITFEGKKIGTTAALTWITTKEINNDYFEILHGTAPNNLKTKATGIKSKAINGNSNATLTYNYIDEQPVIGHNYYKLLQHDLNNNISNSEIVDIYFGIDGTKVMLYPNPTKDIMIAEIAVLKASDATIKIYDVTGRLVQQIETSLVNGTNTVRIDLSSLSSGMYTIKITGGKGLNYSDIIRKD
jgi:GEVED domain/Secretion system C-terminal sorting domain/SprB repeat